MRPPHGVSLFERANPAGNIVLAPLADTHRVAVHLSERTESYCSESDVRYLRRRGDVDIIPAGSRGGFDAETATRSLEIRMTRGFVERVVEDCRLEKTRTFGTRHLVADLRTRQLAAAFLPTDEPTDQLYLDSLGVALTIQLLHAVPGNAATIGWQRLQRVIDYIEAHLGQTLSLVTLADVAGASSAHLRRQFAAHVGEPVHRYVVRRRVARAQELLRAGELSASEVAWAVGFAHQSHLARWMRRLLGTTPRALQPRHRARRS